MFYLPCAALVGSCAEPSFWAAIDQQAVNVSVVDFLRVLIPVTAGNVVGGGLLVGLVYWFIYLRPRCAGRRSSTIAAGRPP